MPARSCAARPAQRFRSRTRSRRGRSQPSPAVRSGSAWLCSFFFVKNELLQLNQGVTSGVPLQRRCSTPINGGKAGAGLKLKEKVGRRKEQIQREGRQPTGFAWNTRPACSRRA